MLSQRKQIKLSRNKYCDLDEKHKELEIQYSILWDSNSYLTKATKTSTPSTSQCCGKCFNLDLNIYSTNLANIEAMRKEIARLNKVIGKGWISVTQFNDKKVDESKEPPFKQGRHPSIKHGLSHTKGAKTNGRRIVNGFECVV